MYKIKNFIGLEELEDFIEQVDESKIEIVTCTYGIGYTVIYKERDPYDYI
jgi:predicted peroxiredoxin